MNEKDLQAFVDKIRSMSAKEIVLSMVDALRNPVVKVDIHSWGEKTNGVCYGCAATNQILKISGFNPEEVLNEWEQPLYSRSNFTESDEIIALKDVVRYFEMAINELRKGNIKDYNRYAVMCGIKELPHSYEKHLYIGNSYTDNDLCEFENFANTF